jgi:hypothetical protein
MRRRRLVVVVASALLAVAGLGVAHAATLAVTSKRLTVVNLAQGATTTCTLAGAGDSHVRSNSTNTNYGTQQTLLVRSQNSSRRRTLVRFNLATCAIPSTATVQSATLTLGLSNATSSRTYRAYRNIETWSETGVTWNNRPDLASTSTDDVVTPPTDGATVSWDVAPDVGLFVAGATTNYGWTLLDAAEGTGNVENQFASEENTGSTAKPALVVKWTP